jgi:rubrerythrin
LSAFFLGWFSVVEIVKIIKEEFLMLPISEKLNDEGSGHQLVGEDLIRAIRLDIAAEYNAIHRYMLQADAVDQPLVESVLSEIASAKRLHVGELERLLEILSGDRVDEIIRGRGEVDEMAAELAVSEQRGDADVLDPDWKEKMQTLKQLGV